MSGGKPHFSDEGVVFTKCSPRAWGYSQGYRLRFEELALFPTRVGVILRANEENKEKLQYSPRGWGYS